MVEPTEANDIMKGCCTFRETTVATLSSARSVYHGGPTDDIKEKGTYLFIVSFFIWKSIAFETIQPKFFLEWTSL